MKSSQVVEEAGLDGSIRLEVAAALRRLAEYADGRCGDMMLMPVSFRFVQAASGREILVLIPASDWAVRETDDGR